MQQSAVAFWRHLTRLHPWEANPFEHEALWWRILRQRAVSRYREIRRRMDWEGPDSPERISAPERADAALRRRELDECAARFLRIGVERQGGKLLRALIRMAAADARGPYERLEVIEQFLFASGRAWTAAAVAAQNGMTPGAAYTNAARLRSWWVPVRRRMFCALCKASV